MIGVLFITFFVLVLLGIPVAFVLGIASTASLVFAGGYPITVVIQRMFAGVDSFPLMAIPFFMLAGSLMHRGGITKRIIDFALGLVGGIKGSLSQVVSIAGVIMGGISGSGVADTAAIGSIMVPEMARRGYNKAFSASLVACSGSIGLIIPPSIALILYGVTAQVSIGDLFLAGIVPGLLIGLGLMIMSYFIAIKNDYPTEGRVSGAEKWRRFKDSSWALMMPIIIIFGIRFGIFTPTEGGAIASFYAIIVGKFIYKELSFKDMPDVFAQAAINTAVISFIIATATLFSWILASEQIPRQVAQYILSISDNKYVILILINAMLLVVGMFLDSGPAIILLTPVLVPIAVSLDINLVQFGLILVINVTIGLLTPPVGTALFVASNISGVPLGQLSRAILKFIALMLFILLLITYIPALTVWAAR